MYFETKTSLRFFSGGSDEGLVIILIPIPLADAGGFSIHAGDDEKTRSKLDLFLGNKKVSGTWLILASPCVNLMDV